MVHWTRDEVFGTDKMHKLCVLFQTKAGCFQRNSGNQKKIFLNRVRIGKTFVRRISYKDKSYLQDMLKKNLL
jgi:hypothetical protein